MPSLTLQTSHEHDNNNYHKSPPKPPSLAPLQVGNNTAPEQSNERPPSPVAPEYSPITPRAQPAVLAAYPPLPENAPPIISSNGSDSNGHPPRLQTEMTPALPPTEYIPEPAPRPFSGEDATDAIALRAAISTLQIQKKKARDDIRTLEKIKQKALDEPEHFKTELAAGRLKEQKPRIGDLQAVLDYDSDDDDDDVEQAILGASRGSDQEVLPDAGQTEHTSGGAVNPLNRPTSRHDSPNTSFDRIPGPQNIVRMPYINWDKYHITGEPLDSLHEQQRKWPGQMPFTQDRGREYAVAAPYSPWSNSADAQGQQRWDRVDSWAVGTPTNLTPTGTVSEHPMETRRKTGQ